MNAPPIRETPRIEALRVRNYRMLRDVRLKNLTGLTVLIGHNGSGKSTLIDVFAFLSECFSEGLPTAWARRGGMDGMRSRGEDGPISIGLKYRERPGDPLITYHIEFDEQDGAPVVANEWMEWRNGRARGGPQRFLCYSLGEGYAVAGEKPGAPDAEAERALASPDLLAADALGQLANYPRAAALRRFVTDWCQPRFTSEALRSPAPRDAVGRLSADGGNLAAVISDLEQTDPDRLAEIVRRLQLFVPHLEQVTTCESANNSVRLQIKDRMFEQPFSGQALSEGALRLLAQLVMLSDPAPPPLIAIEEPEASLHPHRIQEHGETYMMGAERAELIVATQAPRFLNSMPPRDVQFLRRDADGFTIACVATELRGVPDYLEVGGLLGEAWGSGMLEPPKRGGDLV